MFDKLSLYFHTIKYLKLSQVYYRVKKGLKKVFRDKDIDYPVTSEVKCNSGISYIIEELAYDELFISRYNIDEILNNKLTFLNKSLLFSETLWKDANIPQLWRFNSHYFDFIIPLLKNYHKERDMKYYHKTKYFILNWINANVIWSGDGWHPYTISLRLVNWVYAYQIFEEVLIGDKDFRKILLESIYLQYNYLLKNTEKDVLGNHYFENIKTIILVSMFFKNDYTLGKYSKEFYSQLDEQILNDGMHFERSFTYHKIILEDTLMIASWLRQHGKYYRNYLIDTIGKMANCLYSVEADLNVTPQFNDSGHNVGKSTSSILNTCIKYFGISPRFIESLVNSGYYIIKHENMKLIIDCGEISPAYLPAHGQCDALSYELYKDGQPFIVNSGTYEYGNGKWRVFFRSTKAHNTVLIGDCEQAQCWGSFRIAKRSGGFNAAIAHKSFSGSFYNYKGYCHKRRIEWIDNNLLLIIDTVGSESAKSYIHFHPEYAVTYEKGLFIIEKENISVASIHYFNCAEQNCIFGDKNNGWYSPEYGLMYPRYTVELTAGKEKNYFGYVIQFGDTAKEAISITGNNNLLQIDFASLNKQIDLRDF